MQSNTEKLTALLGIRQRRSEQAKKHLAKAKNELEETRQALDKIDCRIQELQHSSISVGQKAYSGEQIPLNQLLAAQLHLQGLREELLKEKQQRQQAREELDEAEDNRAEKAAYFMQMKQKEDNTKKQKALYKKAYEQKVAAFEEELVGEHWCLRYFSHH